MAASDEVTKYNQILKETTASIKQLNTATYSAPQGSKSSGG